MPFDAHQAFGLALQHTVDAVVITDLDSVIRYVNPAFTAQTGFGADEAIGQKPSIQRSPHTTLQTYQEMWRVILGGGWWRGELVNRTKSGQEWTSFLSISQVRDDAGQPMGYVGIGRDITEMKRLQARLREMSLEAIFMLAVAAEAKDEVTGSHVQRVRLYAEALARQLDLPPALCEEIGYSSMMHDVGKLQVPDAVLRKRGALDDEEWQQMRAHPLSGVAILRDKEFYAVARDIAGNHHEHWDGTGYPQGRRGEDIPLSSRIVAVVDVFDALTTARPYKEAWSEARALAELRAQRGRAFDPRVVDAFVALHASGVVRDIRERFPA